MKSIQNKSCNPTSPFVLYAGNMFEFYASEFDNCQLFLTTADDIVDVHTQFEKQWKRNEEQIQIGHDHIGIY